MWAGFPAFFQYWIFSAGIGSGRSWAQHWPQRRHGSSLTRGGIFDLISSISTLDWMQW
jgi:hypothetical protein